MNFLFIAQFFPNFLSGLKDKWEPFMSSTEANHTQVSPQVQFLTYLITFSRVYAIPKFW